MHTMATRPVFLNLYDKSSTKDKQFCNTKVVGASISIHYHDDGVYRSKADVSIRILP